MAAHSIDLDALVDEGTPFTFTFGGSEYILPPDPDIRAVAVLGEGDLHGFLRMLLGPDQWAELQASPKAFTSTRFKALITAYFDHTGVSLGELSGSAVPSKRTAGPSKRTSRASTASRSPKSAPRSRGGASRS